MHSPSRLSALVPGGATSASPAQQAFQQAVEAVQTLRAQLQERQATEAAARRTYWRQIGPLAEQVVAARRALFAPLAEALLLDYFSRAEEQQIREIALDNARTLHERFGEETPDLAAPFGQLTPPPAPPEPVAAPEPTVTDTNPPRRATKAARAQQAAATQARLDEQHLLTNTKTVYRQLARANHPDLERDPAVAAAKTTRMQRITEAYEANDLYTLLHLLAEHAPPTDPATDDVLTRYTQALLRQQAELRQQLQALTPRQHPGVSISPKKREAELRQHKRHLRAEAEYVQHVLGLIREPAGLRDLLKSLSAAGQAGI